MRLPVLIGEIAPNKFEVISLPDSTIESVKEKARDLATAGGKVAARGKREGKEYRRVMYFETPARTYNFFA